MLPKAQQEQNLKDHVSHRKLKTFTQKTVLLVLFCWNTDTFIYMSSALDGCNAELSIYLENFTEGQAVNIHRWSSVGDQPFGLEEFQDSNTKVPQDNWINSLML